MGICKCLQQLRPSVRRSRWLLKLLAASAAAAVIATACDSPKNGSRSDQVVLELQTSERIALPVRNFQKMSDLFPLQVEIEGLRWKLSALRTTSVGDFVAELSMHAENMMPLMAVVKDAGGSEYVVLLKENAQISLISMKNLLEHQKNERLIQVPLSNSHDTIGIVLN